jgi:serine/threonine protein kinase
MRRVYSKKSDVWIFGVLLYEVWTLGMIPYHLIADDKEVARLVTQGERLSRPDNCPQQLYAIMQDCWKSAQKDRPSMPERWARVSGLSDLASSCVHGCYSIADKVAPARASARFFVSPSSLFLSPHPLDCSGVCCLSLSLPLSLSPSLSHYLPLPPSKRVSSSRVGR